MSSYRVLVVDDNHEVRRMVTASVRTLGDQIDVLDVPSAEEALFICSSLPLDLVILDFRLPGMSGLEMVSRLRERKPEIKIILVTGVEDTKIRKQVSEAGVAAYFFKPLEITTFLETVRRCLWAEQAVQPSVSKPLVVSETPSVSEAPGVSKGPGVSKASGISKAPSVSGRPSASGGPSASGAPVISKAPGVTGTPGKSKPPIIRETPRVSGAPSTSGVPSTSGAPGVSKAPGVTGTPGSSKFPGMRRIPSEVPLTEITRQDIPLRFQPTPAERLSALQQQLKAFSALLINESGQVVEIAGNSSELTAISVLLPALMDSFRASKKMYEVLGKEQTESLLCFTRTRQHIYLAPVSETYLLLVHISGFFEPDKLGMIDRAIQLAVQDFKTLLKIKQEEESLKQAGVETKRDELPEDVVIDEETLAVVADMFSKIPEDVTKEDADGFWEALRENGALDEKGGKDVLTYDEAREMGLAPNEDQQA